MSVCFTSSTCSPDRSPISAARRNAAAGSAGAAVGATAAPARGAAAMAVVAEALAGAGRWRASRPPIASGFCTDAGSAATAAVAPLDGAFTFGRARPVGDRMSALRVKAGALAVRSGLAAGGGGARLSVRVSGACATEAGAVLRTDPSAEDVAATGGARRARNRGAIRNPARAATASEASMAGRHHLDTEIALDLQKERIALFAWELPDGLAKRNRLVPHHHRGKRTDVRFGSQLLNNQFCFVAKGFQAHLLPTRSN